MIWNPELIQEVEESTVTSEPATNEFERLAALYYVLYCYVPRTCRHVRRLAPLTSWLIQTPRLHTDLHVRALLGNEHT